MASSGSTPWKVATPRKAPAVTDIDEQPHEVLRTAASGASGFANIVTVKVGSEANRETFILHEYLLRESSIFFDNALKGEWKEAQNRVVVIPDMSAEAFRIYVKFLLTSFLFVKDDEPKVKVTGEPDPVVFPPGQMERCISSPKLANYLQASDFKDGILDVVMQTMQELNLEHGRPYIFDAGTISKVYTHSQAGSPIRKFIIRVCLRDWKSIDYGDRDFDKHPSDFWKDFIKASGLFTASKLNARDIRNPTNAREACAYHEHVLQNKPCYKTKHIWLKNDSGSAPVLVPATATANS